MTTWTVEKRAQWKQTLKQMIKSSGQTQVEVAKEMARRVSLNEDGPVVETSFVAPLSRFVNAKGSEITRWFEQQQERLLPLAQALRLSSVEPLNLAHQQILLGEIVQTIHHPAFPTVEWKIDWEHCLSQNVRLAPLDDFTMALLSEVQIESPLQHPWWKGGQILKIPWSMIRPLLLTEHLEHSVRQRLEGLSESVWSNCPMGLSDSLWWLYTVLHRDELWTNTRLRFDWLTQMQGFWSEHLDTRFKQSNVLHRLTLEQRRDWLYHLWMTIDPMGVDIEDWLASFDWCRFSTTEGVGISNEILTDLRSTESTVRELALRTVEDWIQPLTPETFLDDAIRIGLLIQDDGRLYLRDPWCWLPIMKWNLISIPESFCLSELWYPALTWVLRLDDVESIQSLVSSQPQSWWMDQALTWLWMVSSVEVSQILIQDSVVQIGTIACSDRTLIQHWLNLLRLAQSRLIFGSTLVSHVSYAEIVRRYHLFSKRLCRLLPTFDVILTGDVDVSRAILEQYAPYQSSIRSENDWLEQQKRVSYPIWEILERRAECSDLQCAILLATTMFNSVDPNLSPPREIQLHWLARIPSQPNHLVLFQQLMVEYWSGSNPSLPLVLQVAEDIGFDTVLSWMGGWMNPLYWLQNPEEAQTLSRLSIAFAEHFTQYDLLEQWLYNLWDWLKVETSVESGFAVWKGRRVPVQSVNIDLVEGLMLCVLNEGVPLCPSSSLALEMAKHTHHLPAGDRLYPVCREVKELLLQQLNLELCASWIDSAPRVDLDIERMALQFPELLNILWRMDDQQRRRTDILRLAALLPTIPMWAVREAEKIVHRTSVWPNWLSPFSREVAHLVPHMMQGRRLIDRIWWARVLFHHSKDLSETWDMLQTLFQHNVQSHSLQTVHFLSPDSTPMMDCDDLLRWISVIQRELPEQWNSRHGQRFQHILLHYWHVESSQLSESQLFMMLSILAKDVRMHELLSLTTVEQLWPRVSASGRQVLLDNWLSCQDSETLIDVLEHRLVGSAALHALFVAGHPIVNQRILSRIASGDLSVLDMAMQYEVTTDKLIEAIAVTLEQAETRRLLHAWIIRNTRKWQGRDLSWHVWVRDLLGQI